MKNGVLLASALSAPVAAGGCLGIMGVAVLSVELTAPGQVSADQSLLTGVALAFLPVDVFLTVVLAEGEVDLSYFDQHRQAIRVAVVRGDGPFVRDLAQALELPAALIPALGEVLQDARPGLEPILIEDGPFDRDRAWRFATRLVGAIEADERLAPAIGRLRERLAPPTGVTYAPGGGDAERS